MKNIFESIFSYHFDLNMAERYSKGSQVLLDYSKNLSVSKYDYHNIEYLPS